MKNKALFITTIIFFVLINTQYYWEGLIWGWDMVAMLTLFIIFIIIAISILIQVYNLIKEKFQSISRLILILLMSLVFSATAYRPMGLIDFSKYEEKDLLIANREGVANCMTTLKLKESNKFFERNVCFGVTKFSGHYSILNDTIIFTKTDLISANWQYKFAIIKPSEEKKSLGEIILYKTQNDTMPLALYITQNKLTK